MSGRVRGGDLATGALFGTSLRSRGAAEPKGRLVPMDAEATHEETEIAWAITTEQLTSKFDPMYVAGVYVWLSWWRDDARIPDWLRLLLDMPHVIGDLGLGSFPPDLLRHHRPGAGRDRRGRGGPAPQALLCLGLTVPVLRMMALEE